MIVFQIISWIVAIFCTIIFLRFFLIPHIKRKIFFYRMSKKLKKEAKKHSGKSAEQINDIAKALMDLSKKEKL